MANFSAIALPRWILYLPLLLLLTGCSQDNPTADSSEPKRLKVVTSFTVIADMASNVAGDTAEVISVTKAGAEIHNYQPTPKDISRTADADLILWNGMGLELWFEKFLAQLDGVDSSVVTDGIQPIAIGNGPYSGKPNPHAWMSPTDAMTYVDNIASAMAAADPDNATTYNSNAETYKQKILAVAEPLRQKLDNIPENARWLVSSEGAFSYLARDFDLNELYLWPINADQQGTPSQVKNVIDTVREHNIPSIFSESTVSPKPAQQVARETGTHYGGVLYVDSLSQADGPVPSYLDLLRVTTETLVQGLMQGVALASNTEQSQ
ncbi:MAG: metal ABC transporter substrate-binding protein [Granulosicoccus sp.]|nr:metal ABC transporter substrate-binding protein [Granulosicoccus sp.]